MDFLKSIPITYKGELHEVQLINFSLDINEVQFLVPEELAIREFDGRAIISMVNVKLKNMRFKGLCKKLGFNYQHIGFRLLVDDSDLNNGQQKGIYFIRSFSNKGLLAWAGRQLTDYKLEKATFRENSKFRVEQGNNYLEYELDEAIANEGNSELKFHIGNVDRAYSIRNGEVFKTQIIRKKWPIEWVNCTDFSTNFFNSAEFLGAFRVKEVIHYEWLPPMEVKKAS